MTFRKHIMADLEPYVCIFEDCATPHDLYNDSREWLHHLQWKHTLQWTCTVQSHEPQSFDSADDFEVHMRKKHAGSFENSQLPILTQRSARPAAHTFVDCPLCNGAPENLLEMNPEDSAYQTGLRNHIVTHLKSLALISLPWRDDLIASPKSNSTSSGGDRESLEGFRANLPLPTFDDITNLGLDNDDSQVPTHQHITPDAPPDQSWTFINHTLGFNYEGHDKDPTLIQFVQRT